REESTAGVEEEGRHRVRLRGAGNLPAKVGKRRNARAASGEPTTAMPPVAGLPPAEGARYALCATAISESPSQGVRTTRPNTRSGLRNALPSPTKQKFDIVAISTVASPAATNASPNERAENRSTCVGSSQKLHRRPSSGRARLPALSVITNSLPPG